MTAEEKIYAVLSANAGVTALVPASRIKVTGDYQNLAKPYLVHFPVAGETIQTHQGMAALRLWQNYQVSVYASDYGSARRIADAVVAALDNYRDTDTDRIALAYPPVSLGFDTDLKVAHIALDFEVAGALT